MHCMHKYHAACLGNAAEFEQVPRRRMLDDLKCPLCKRRGKDLTAAYREVVSNTRCAGMVGSPREIVVDDAVIDAISDTVIDDAVDEVSPGQPRPPSPVCAKAKALSKPPSKATQMCRNKAKARGKAFARPLIRGQKTKSSGQPRRVPPKAAPKQNTPVIPDVPKSWAVAPKAPAAGAPPQALPSPLPVRTSPLLPPPPPPLALPTDGAEPEVAAPKFAPPALPTGRAEPKSPAIGAPAHVEEPAPIPTRANAPSGYCFCETCGRHQPFGTCRLIRKGDNSMRCTFCRSL